jgi:hypothetical protein
MRSGGPAARGSSRAHRIGGLILAAAGGAAILIAACSEGRGSLGDDCMKDQDCLSGVCTALRCVAAPSVLDGGLPPTEASTIPEAAADGAQSQRDVMAAPDGETSEGASAADSVAQADAPDADHDAAGDATLDDAADGEPDGSIPADTGAAADAPVDVRPGG